MSISLDMSSLKIDTLFVNFKGPFILSFGYLYILVAMDCILKWVKQFCVESMITWLWCSLGNATSYVIMACTPQLVVLMFATSPSRRLWRNIQSQTRFP